MKRWVSAVGFLMLSCGAESAEAPRAVLRNPDAAQCKSFAQLMPNFLALIDEGRTQNLACVIKAHLLKGRTESDTPPLNDVLRALFGLLNAFARKPSELGAPLGQLCAPDEPQSAWPAVRQANELCELRRAMYLLVHEGKGIDAVTLVDPQISGAVSYITGKGKDGTEHYEVAGVVSRMCSQNAQCQLSNGLDLLISLSAYLEGADGKKTLDDLRTLVKSPRIQAFFSSEGTDALTEDGAVALARVLLPALQNASPTDLQNLLDQPPINKFKTELQPLVDDLKQVVMTPALAGPLKKTISCYVWADANLDLVRMAYRLGLRDRLPEFGFTRIEQLIEDLQSIDSRGALVHLLGTVGSALRADEQAIDSAASVCSTLFSTKSEDGQAKSNAQLALPVVGDLFAAGVASEALCAIDTLVWGCAGGAQPACMATTRRPPSGGVVPAACSNGGVACCRHCAAGEQPCGDACISSDATCAVSGGCACP
ncbi:MAG: hypothetical protein IPJ65_18695 [Archangiaceae bacterium]|nr:hypothetical protein [Archangiaceae bacterium]